ncbi:leukotriene-B4 omega-hydroxylase 3-like [Ruditapes philippinarum]|uniref:leukotriene-B4 omega-hydroxylase 3-like n=1 Tax=Ruditapes philippinarum TaxID=129788 RepID=UPI00295BA4B6|nr:leukotriene-B4 omega-hydroxylase 3-like [Ruditapes philippinarum]
MFPTLNVILQTVLLIIGTYIFYHAVSIFIKYRQNKKIFNGAKGPEKYHWLFGSYFYLPTDSHELTTYLMEMGNKYGSEQGYVVLWGMLGKLILFPTCPRVTAKVLKGNEPKSMGLDGAYRHLYPWLGDGLLVANGEKWARNRRLLTPAFHFDILKPYMNVYNQSADVFVKKLAAKAKTNERFEVFQHVCMYTLEVILKCAFSYSEDVQTAGESNEYASTVNRITDALTCRFFNPLMHFDVIWNLSSTGRQFKKDCDFVHAVAEEVIDKRRDALNKQDSTKSSSYTDFLDILLTARDEDGQGLTKLEIRNEVDTFLFEGHDTTASALAWILYSLAEHPECQQKCQTEIDEILAGRETDDLEWYKNCSLYRNIILICESYIVMDGMFLFYK